MKLLHLALVLSLAAAGCSSEARSSYGTPPLADLRIPAAAPAGWDLASAGARIVPLGLDHALFLPKSADPKAVLLPFRAGLKGARSVRVLCMADGNFELAGSLAGQPLTPRPGTDTKRQVHTLELPLAAPLAEDAGALELRCTGAQVPVLVLRVQVMG